ncbi:hypothetical protein N8940_01895 [Sphingomonadaceae bacterium]|nr:hypothetical protein [Sphingomonadaceae bacterium]
MKSLFAGKRKPLFIALGLTSLLASVALASSETTVLRVCKPVVPQVIVELNAGDTEVERSNLFIRYDESGSNPFSKEAFSKSPRFTSCQSIDSQCVASRKRYEIRLEGERFQSIQILNMTEGENPIIGGVRWEGASYPNQVKIKCDTNNLNVREACILKRLSYSVDEGARSALRHDQCLPIAF